MRLIDYLLNKEVKGSERDFMLKYADAITNTTYDVIVDTEAPFEKTDAFLRFARNILDGADLPKGKELTKYRTWTKYIIDTTKVVSNSWYQQIHDDEIDDMKNKYGSLHKYTYKEIEQMKPEELLYIVDITIENASVLSSFLHDHKKELFGGDDK